MLKLVDDVLDFTGTEEQLGKPVSIDLKLGLATGPVLFAAQEYPELQILISRKYFLPPSFIVSGHENFYFVFVSSVL